MVWPKLCNDLIAKDDITAKLKFHGISNTRKIKQNKQNINRRTGSEMGSSCFKRNLYVILGRHVKHFSGKSRPCLWYKNIIVRVIDVLLFPWYAILSSAYSNLNKILDILQTALKVLFLEWKSSYVWVMACEDDPLRWWLNSIRIWLT